MVEGSKHAISVRAQRCKGGSALGNMHGDATAI